MSENRKLGKGGLELLWNKIVNAINNSVITDIFSTSENGLVPKSTDTSKYLKGDGTWDTPTNTDTKNTAGSTDTSSKIFLIGATSQATNPATYSHDTAYVGTDGYLYSNSKKVIGVTEVTGTLSAGSTSITLSNSAITTSSTIEPFTSIFGANPKTITVSAGKAVLTFDSQSAAMTVKIRVS